VATVPLFDTVPLAAAFTVTTPDGSVASASDFAIDGQISLSEHKGSSGEPITLTGSGFTGATQVVFGTWQSQVLGDEAFSLAKPKGAHFRVLGDTKIAVTVPLLSAGTKCWVAVVSPTSTSISGRSSPFLVVRPRLLRGTYEPFAIHPTSVGTEAGRVFGIGNLGGQRAHAIRWRAWSATRANGTGTAWCPYGTSLRGCPGSIRASRVRGGRFTRITISWRIGGRTHRQTLRLDGTDEQSGGSGYWWQP
jgi:hypothetical protein